MNVNDIASVKDVLGCVLCIIARHSAHDGSIAKRRDACFDDCYVPGHLAHIFLFFS